MYMCISNLLRLLGFSYFIKKFLIMLYRKNFFPDFSYNKCYKRAINVHKPQTGTKEIEFSHIEISEGR